MSMVGELMRRQRELVKIIQSKDKELEDYKNQGVKVTRSKTSILNIMHSVQLELLKSTGFPSHNTQINS